MNKVVIKILLGSPFITFHHVWSYVQTMQYPAGDINMAALQTSSAVSNPQQVSPLLQSAAVVRGGGVYWEENIINSYCLSEYKYKERYHNAALSTSDWEDYGASSGYPTWSLVKQMNLVQRILLTGQRYKSV